MKLIKIVLASGLVVSLAACATPPEPEIIEEVVEVVEPEVLAPIPEVVERPVVEETPLDDPNLPVAGSVADFAYQSGGEPRIYFGYDQFTLSPEALQALSAQADWLKTYTDMNAIIEGHADERGTREYNLALAARRAEAVKAFLVSQGVAAARLTTVSYGKERPIDARSTEEGWARNRNGFTNLTTGGLS
jgi:peptidoglycan-associated lipoprotein